MDLGIHEPNSASDLLCIPPRPKTQGSKRHQSTPGRDHERPKNQMRQKKGYTQGCIVIIDPYIDGLQPRASIFDTRSLV